VGTGWYEDMCLRHSQLLVILKCVFFKPRTPAEGTAPLRPAYSTDSRFVNVRYVCI